MSDFWLGFAFGCLALGPVLTWLAIPYVNMIILQKNLEKSQKELEKTAHIELDADTKNTLKEADALIADCHSKSKS